MARAIKSPGVQIVETDLSNYQQFGGGTTVFVPGFAKQGPSDEVLLVSSVSELEQIYGAPETPAERYFYYSCKELLNSPATVLTTRLPYGSGSGADFTNGYSALLYPVASGVNGFVISEPTHISLDEETYERMVQNNINWGPLNETVTTEVTSIELSSVTATPDTSATILNELLSLDPTPETYSLSFGVNNVTITTEYILSAERTGAFASFDFENDILRAGIVVINSAQTPVNEYFEGYYLAIADNTNFGPDLIFDSVTNIKSLTSSNGLYTIPQDSNRLGFELSGTIGSAGTNTVSEVIESVPTYNFGDTYYKDSISINVFKVRNSIYEPQSLTYSLVESHIGSLDYGKKTVAVNGGVEKSFFISNLVNQSSQNIKVFVNPLISENTKWASNESNIPEKNVIVNDSAKTMYSYGVYTPTYTNTSTKESGNLFTKLTRALSLVDTIENTDIDIVVDAGLSTIFANASANNDNGAFYDDRTYLKQDDLLLENSATVEKWRTAFNLFNTFASNTRQDCMFISDPLRQIFVNGEDSKTTARKGYNFTSNIYTPLKNLYSTVNTNYAATYGNWVKTYDAFSDKFIWLPSSGYMAAAFARTDAIAQPWIAPAGLNRGVINNIVDIAFNPNQKQRDYLYTISINPVVSFPGEGFVIFGQKTLQNKPSAFDRINVRRLFLTLERAVRTSLKYFVFEPNTDFTRTRLKNTILPIFEQAKNTEGLYDYLIVCDERNNTPDVIDRNELAVDIYIKPVKAAEFILVNFIATRTGQNFQELI